MKTVQIYEELLALGVHEDYLDEMTPEELQRKYDQMTEAN